MARQWHLSGTSLSPQWHLSGTSVAVVVAVAVVVHSVAPRWHLARWHLVECFLVEFPARRHPVSCPGPPGQLDNLVLPTLCGRVRSDASAGCSGHAQRHRFGPALRLRQSAVVKRHFPPAKSFIRAGVTTRGHRFQPRIPPGSLYSKPYNLYGGSPAILSPAQLLPASSL